MGEEGEPVNQVDGKEGEREQYAGHLINVGDRVSLKFKLFAHQPALVGLPLPLLL